MRTIKDCSGSRKPGERTPQGTARIKEELHQVGARAIVDDAIDRLEPLLGPSTPHEQDDAPASERRRIEPFEEGEDTEPPTSRTGPPSGEPPPPLSALAFRLTDGAFLVSLEEAGDRDLEGRELVTCLVLNEAESDTARARVTGGAGEAAAHILARLPKRRS